IVGAFGQSDPQRPPPRMRWLIAPSGERAEIDANTTSADLTKQFGPANVSQAPIYLGEGSYTDGTVIYGDDPLRRVELIWKDQSGPARLGVRGDRSQWAIAPGISLGMSLVEIERANGGPFTLTGFAWDYSGTIVGWQGGR